MHLTKPFILGNYLFTDLVSANPPIIQHRTIYLADKEFYHFRMFKNVDPRSQDIQDQVVALKREAETLQRINLRSVPRFHDFGMVKDYPFLVTEYVWGKSLLQILRELKIHQKMLSPDYACFIARELCHCLGRAHAITSADHPDGITHLHLNPRNVIISYTGTVNVVQFGRPAPAAKVQIGRASCRERG